MKKEVKKIKKTKGRVYKWLCRVSDHELPRGENYAKGFKQKIDRKRKIRRGVCEFHVNLNQDMMQKRFRGL